VASSVGYESECAVRADHTLWCWGNNSEGELGDGTTNAEALPEQVGTATNWSSVSVGYLNACATTLDGQLWCWGFNNHGQLGTGDTVRSLVPVQVGAGTNWSAAESGTLAIGT
jgi:alpha-tubulin suppressor-like RCC1 family protein